MNKTAKIAKKLVKNVKQTQSKTSPYDTTATIMRVVDKTAWVRIPGGKTDTPVQLTINAKPGDKVQLRVAGGSAWITGNATAPPTDNARADESYQKAEEVEELANDTRKNVDELQQHFWLKQSGFDAGAHITDVPREEFEKNGGGNLKATSRGVKVRMGYDDMAIFERDHMQMNTYEGLSYFNVDFPTAAVLTSFDVIEKAPYRLYRYEFDAYDYLKRTQTHLIDVHKATENTPIKLRQLVFQIESPDQMFTDENVDVHGADDYIIYSSGRGLEVYALPQIYEAGTSSTEDEITITYTQDGDGVERQISMWYHYDADEDAIHIDMKNSKPKSDFIIFPYYQYAYKITSKPPIYTIGTRLQPEAYAEDMTFSIGEGLTVWGTNQVVMGKYNEPKLVFNRPFVFGWGSDDSNRQNLLEIDANGNLRPLDSIVLTAPNGNKYKLTVNDSGQLSTTAVND